MENTTQFEKRKQDHIRIALDYKSQTLGQGGFDKIELVHEALPDLNFNQINIKTNSLSTECSSPFFVSSMTAGHKDGEKLNLSIAKACAEKSWWMGVGSQRRQLFDSEARGEWERIRKESPNTQFIGNIGVTQLIQTPTSEIKKLTDSLQAKAFFVHLNPLQECVQREGTPQFKGGAQAIEKLCRELEIPVILKEVGSGFSQKTVERCKNLGIAALDVSGKGGTHWGRVETLRYAEADPAFKVGQTFQDWGISTVDSLLQARSVDVPFEIWASGGIRNGLEAAKLLALGAKRVGIAQPILMAAIEEIQKEEIQNDDNKSVRQNKIVECMEVFEKELKIAMFCTNSETISELKKAWMFNQKYSANFETNSFKN
jgi:isopentenyl-diphosphate delta-isomerase